MRHAHVVQRMVRAGRLERVEPDPVQAGLFLEHARAHLDSARSLVATDPAGAFTLAYDAVRKTLSAMLMREGLRAKSSGGHAAVGDAAAALFPDLVDEGTFTWLRQTRNATEYGSTRYPAATVEDVLEAADIAQALLDEVAPSD